MELTDRLRVPHTLPMTTTVKTYADVQALPTGERFSIRLTKATSWKDRHGILYRTANREVTLTLKDGSKVTGRLDETPGYFSQGTKAGPKVWLRIPGRKTRKGINALEITHVVGFKAPTLAEATSAYIILNSSNPTDEQIAEARVTAARM